MLAAALSACSERELVVYTLTQTLKLALNAQCDGDEGCIDAVAEQLPACLEENKDIDALVKAGGEDDELTNQVVRDITACIVDEGGEPYFIGATAYEYDESENENESTQQPQSRTIIPK